jgi:hypothetical protein
MIIAYCVIIFGTSCAIHNSRSDNENIIWRATVEVRILILNADGTEFLRKSKVLFFNFKDFRTAGRGIGLDELGPEYQGTVLFFAFTEFTEDGVKAYVPDMTLGLLRSGCTNRYMLSPDIFSTADYGIDFLEHGRRQFYSCTFTKVLDIVKDGKSKKQIFFAHVTVSWRPKEENDLEYQTKLE